jgi:hypothetical protein
MTETQYLLGCLGEECAEVAQRASKASRFGLLETQPGQPLTNEDRILGELHDLIAVAGMLGLVPQPPPGVDMRLNVPAFVWQAKVEKVRKYMGLSRELGQLGSRIE